MTKEKKNKGHENTIGKIIYGFLLFMPLLAIGITCLTYVFNRKVEQQTQNAQIEYEYKTNEVNNQEDLIKGNLYKFNITQWTNSVNNDDAFGTENDSTLIYTIKTTNKIIYTENPTFLMIQKINQNELYIQTNLTGRTRPISNFQTMNIYFIYTDYETTDEFTLWEYLEKADINIIKSVNITESPTTTQTVFYDAVNNVEQSNLFNWAKETETYNVINTTTTLLGIENTFIDMLLTYWLLISVIYLIYDIGLMAVQIAHKKIHELEESI